MQITYSFFFFSHQIDLQQYPQILNNEKKKKKTKKNPLEVVQTFSHQQQPTLFPLATVETQTDVS